MEPNVNVDSSQSKQEATPSRRNTRFTNFLLVILTLGLSASVWANLKLYRMNQAYVTQAYAARADLVNEQYFASANARLTPPQQNMVRMVFVGDSDVELWDPLPAVKGAQIISRGLGGDRSGDLLLRLQRDVIGLKPTVAVVSIGGNDLEDLGSFPDVEEDIIKICERNIRFIVEDLRQRQIQVVLLTIFPYGDPDADVAPGWSDATYGAVERVNATIRTLGGPGVMVIDCDPFLALPNGRRNPNYSRDLYHLNPLGYAALNQALAPVLESLTKK